MEEKREKKSSTFCESPIDRYIEREKGKNRDRYIYKDVEKEPVLAWFLERQAMRILTQFEFVHSWARKKERESQKGRKVPDW